jgi:hypothetical protein
MLGLAIADKPADTTSPSAAGSCAATQPNHDTAYSAAAAHPQAAPPPVSAAPGPTATRPRSASAQVAAARASPPTPHAHPPITAASYSSAAALDKCLADNNKPRTCAKPTNKQSALGRPPLCRSGPRQHQSIAAEKRRRGPTSRQRRHDSTIRPDSSTKGHRPSVSGYARRADAAATLYCVMERDGSTIERMPSNSKVR